MSGERPRALVCGSRDWQDLSLVESVLRELSPREVIHGGARGADALVGVAAESLGIPVRTFPADWARHGRAAGPIRNEQMLREGRPDLVVAFHDDPDLGRGTADMVRRALAAGVPVRVVHH